MKSFYGMCSMIYFNILSCIRNVNISSLFLFLLDHYIVSWYTCSRLHLNNIRIRISIQDSSQNHLFIEYENSTDAYNSTVFFKDFSIDGSKIKVDKDLGFEKGREYGRGIFGGSARNDIKRKRFYDFY